jgi:hypothetical protein
LISGVQGDLQERETQEEKAKEAKVVRERQNGVN